LLYVVCFYSQVLAGGAYPYQIWSNSDASAPVMPVVGAMQFHQVREEETLLDIARDYGLGFNEILGCHPEADPWLPEIGSRLEIPTVWILPPTRYESVVINIPELRLYRFFRNYRIVKTYPIGIGREGFETPVTDCRVVQRLVHPSWTVPPLAQAEYTRSVIPPGPDNPLGDYWIGLSVTHLGIHGTNVPWGVGRRVSHGCMRLYPEDISRLFKETDAQTRVEIIYEPIKIGIRDDRIHMEVHPDIYGRIDDLQAHAGNLIRKAGIDEGAIDWKTVRQCIRRQQGVPTEIGDISENLKR